MFNGPGFLFRSQGLIFGKLSQSVIVTTSQLLPHQWIGLFSVKYFCEYGMKLPTTHPFFVVIQESKNCWCTKRFYGIWILAMSAKTSVQYMLLKLYEGCEVNLRLKVCQLSHQMASIWMVSIVTSCKKLLSFTLRRNSSQSPMQICTGWCALKVNQLYPWTRHVHLVFLRMNCCPIYYVVSLKVTTNHLTLLLRSFS